MKKIILLLGIIFLLSACNSIEEKKAEKAITRYYEAMINEKYASAFKELLLYDDKNAYKNGTTLSITEAEAIFAKKTIELDAQQYRLTDFNITEVEYEDGHSFWHHVEVSGLLGDVPFTVHDTVFDEDGKLYFSSDDKWMDWRNGYMGN